MRAFGIAPSRVFGIEPGTEAESRLLDRHGLSRASAKALRARIGRTPSAPAAMNQERPSQEAERYIAAMHRGLMDGRRFAGDPWRAAEALNATVIAGDATIIRARGSDGWSLRNPSNAAGPHLICLSEAISGRYRASVLAHEIGHLQLGQDASEAETDAYARAFLDFNPPGIRSSGA
jgi:hypothetical protein